jgi:hypothetical protein
MTEIEAAAIDSAGPSPGATEAVAAIKDPETVAYNEKDADLTKNESDAAGNAKPARNAANKARKVALYVAYVGHGYAGMQRNPGVLTVEDEIVAALHKAGAISDANADNSNNQQFSKVCDGSCAVVCLPRLRANPVAPTI